MSKLAPMEIVSAMAGVMAGLTSAAAWASNSSPGVVCWGQNSQGQTNVPTDIVSVPVPSQVAEVRTARGNTCVLDKMGKVSCWGLPMSYLAQLQALSGVTTFSISSNGACAAASDGVHCFAATSDQGIQTVPAGLTKVKSLGVGGAFACALANGAVSCWGDTNGFGVTTIPALANPRKLVVGTESACALDDAGLHCWGQDDPEIIGNMPTLVKPTDIFMGTNYACAVDQGSVQCWGNSTATTYPAVPQVPAKPSAAAIFATGQAHVCMLDQGSVQCWGYGAWGQLAVPQLSHPSALFGDALGNQTCALDDNGLSCWGEDQAGQASFGAVSSLSAGVGNTCAVVQGKLRCWGETASAINAAPSMTDAYRVAVGSNFACFQDVGSASILSCWGGNQALQISSPALPSLDYTSAGNGVAFAPAVVAAGLLHACEAAASNGTVTLSCWGNNDFGQARVPVGVSSTGASGALSVGGYHTCSIDPALGLKCWGQSGEGQINVPSTLKNPRQVAAGFAHTCALDDGGVTCWGRADEGQTAVPALKNPTFISAGGYHTCAIDANGLQCWGANGLGQASVPTGLSKRVATVSAGLFHTCAAVK